MKKYIFFVLFVIINSFVLNAQKKILFDNTKDEQAGNADWVIDDGTSQYPSPAQSGITASTSETYWSGSLSSWGVALVKRGYHVETLPPGGKITYGDASNSQDLSNYDVFIVDEPNDAFSSTEEKAMIDFVNNGGGLFIVSDHAGADRNNNGLDALTIWDNFFNDYNNPFGFTFDANSNISQDPATNVANLPSDPVLHGVAGDVEGLAFYNGATMTIDKTANSAVVALVYYKDYSNTGTTGVMAVRSTYGKGKVVGLGDSSVPEDKTPNSGTTYNGWNQPAGSTATGDDSTFCMNATIWLLSNSTAPSLSSSVSSLSGFSYFEGNGPSSSQSFALTGSNLDGSDVTVTAPADYEISFDNSNFSNSLTLSSYDGTSKTIYVRLKSNLSVGTYNNENITISGGGASDITVNLSGEVKAAGLDVSPASLTGLDYTVGNGPSAVSHFDISGGGLDGSKVTISAPSDYEISLDNSTFSSSLTISYTAPDLANTTVYVRLKAGLSKGTYNETITCSDNGSASDKTLAVSGTVSDSPELIISEIAGKGLNADYNNEYIEIINRGSSSVDLTNWTLEYYESSNLEANLNLTGTIAANSAYVIAVRTTYTSDLHPDFVPSKSFSLNNDCHLVLKNNGTIEDEAGSASDQFTKNINYEFTDCPNDNKPVANWDNLGTNNGTPGQVNCKNSAKLSSSVSSLSGFSYVKGNGPSSSQSFALTGSNLDGSDVTVTAPSDYEISLDNSNFSNSLTLSSYDGTSKTIYVRLKSNLSVGTYNNENITISGGGASDITVSLSGEVLTPTLSANPTSLSGFSYSEGGGPSSSQSFALTGSNLDGSDVTVTAPTDYELSFDNSNFSNALTLSSYDGTSKTIYVRLKSNLSVGTYNNENITISGGGASDITVNLSGEVKAASASCATSLIISEYYEGASNDKYIELYNNTGSAIDLSNYVIKIYANGSSTATSTVSLSGTLSNATAYVVANSSANSTILSKADATSGSLTYNGDDAVSLEKTDGTLVDVIGQIGYDPGTEWGTGDASTKDNMLIRKSNIFGGDNNGSDSFDPSVEWNGYPTGDYSNMGKHNMACTCSEPTTDASDIVFSNVNATSMDLSWTSGNGTSRIVVAKQGQPVDWTPSDKTTYAANSSFGSGTELSSGNYVVYNGSGNSFTLTNLKAGTTYYFKIFEYSCSAGNEDYLTSGVPAAADETTLPNDVTDLSLVCSTTTSAEISWSLPTGNYDGILVTALAGGTPVSPSCSGSSLSSANSDYSAAPAYCGNTASQGVYLFNGVATNLSVSGLSAGQSYTVKVFVYKNSSWSLGKSITFSANISDVTNLTADCGNTESTLNWTNPDADCYDEVLVVAKDGSAIATSPSGDGSSYTANQTFGSGTDISSGSGEYVVYKGTAENVTVTGLTNGHTYFFKTFVRKASSWSAGKEVNCTPSNATKLDYGDLAIVAVNTNVQDYFSSLDAGTDEIRFLCFKDITPDTRIDMTDNGYEKATAGKWGDTEGLVSITRKNSTLPAGTVIVLRGHGQASKWHIFIGDGSNTHNLINDDANWSVSDGGSGDNLFDLNVEDQVWMMQGGDWIDPPGTDNAYYTGKVLYGWTATGWKSAPGYNSTKGSTLYGQSQCSQTNVVGVDNQDRVMYFSDTSATTQRAWISRFNNGNNWKGNTSTKDYLDNDTLPDKIRILSGGFSSDAQWTGETSSDWNDCTNWLNLKVPDTSADVVFISDDCYNDIVIPANDTVICNSLTIKGDRALHSIKMQSGNTSVLQIHGDLTINQDSVFNLDDGDNTSADAVIEIYGNWKNNVGDKAIDLGNSTVIFKGNSKQTIYTIDTQQNFYNLTIDNSSPDGVVINKNLNVTGKLSLNNGVLDLNGENLTLNGDYSKNNGVIRPNSASDLIIKGTGNLDEFVFAAPQQLNSLTMNRPNASAILASDLTMTNMYIYAGNVKLKPGKFFTVGSTITNNVGENGLILESDATGTASLLHNTENLQATCQRYIRGGAWSYFFSPLSAVPTSTFYGSNPNFYKYDETTDDYWKNYDIYGTSGWKNESNSTLSTDEGYITYAPNSIIYTLKGGHLYFDATNQNKVFTLSYTDVGSGAVNQNGVTDDWDDFEGWNLIGNPFTCAIDWDKVVLNNVDNVIYYYDGVSQNYKYYGSGNAYNQGITVNGGSEFIPANQAFFIKASANNATVTIPNSARVHNSVRYLKKSVSKIPENIIRLKISGTHFSDETVIRYLANASKFHDSFDAYKKFSFNKNVPQVFSMDCLSGDYAINNLPFANHRIVHLGFVAKNPGIYTFDANLITLKNYHIYLFDAKKNILQNLRQNPVYNFDFFGGIDTSRFQLIISKNRAPYTAIAIADEYKKIGEQINIQVPKAAFVDADAGDYLKLSAKMADGSDLPDWLRFDNGSFYGLATDTGTFNIIVSASDIFGANASQDFKLVVLSNNASQNIDNKFEIYPNPCNDKVNIYIPQILPNTRIRLYDQSGKMLMKKQTDDEQNELNLLHLSPGLYIIEVENDIINQKQKLIVR